MDMLMALAVSIGVLIAVWVKVGAMASLAVPAGIVAWGLFYAAGGKTQGLQKVIASTLSGVEAAGVVVHPGRVLRSGGDGLGGTGGPERLRDGGRRAGRGCSARLHLGDGSRDDREEGLNRRRSTRRPDEIRQGASRVFLRRNGYARTAPATCSGFQMLILRVSGIRNTLSTKATAGTTMG